MSLSTPEKISIAQLAIQVAAFLAGLAFFFLCLHVALPPARVPAEQGPPVVAEEPPK